MLAESWRSRKSSSSSCSMGCCSSGGRGGVVMGLQVALGFGVAWFDIAGLMAELLGIIKE